MLYFLSSFSLLLSYFSSFLLSFSFFFLSYFPSFFRFLFLISFFPFLLPSSLPLLCFSLYEHLAVCFIFINLIGLFFTIFPNVFNPYMNFCGIIVNTIHYDILILFLLLNNPMQIKCPLVEYPPLLNRFSTSLECKS